MASKNIVHQYFKKELEGVKILLKVDPIYLKSTELRISVKGEIEVNLLEVDATIVEDLKANGYLEVNAMEFNLYDAGLL